MLNYRIILYAALIGIPFIVGITYNPTLTYAGSDMVLIPDGAFLMGSSEKEGIPGKSIGVDEIPQQSVILKAYYIDKYEVTNKDYKTFIDAVKYPPPETPYDKDTFAWTGSEIPDGQEDYPVTYVNWNDADAYCRWAGKRLSSEAEWEKAARGTDGRQWPWGNESRGDACNTKYTVAGMLLPKGSIASDVSPYGVYDMCGNVAEWTSSYYLPYPGSTLKRESFGKKFIIARGGSWVMPAFPYSRVSYRANSYLPEYKHRGLGFRCVKDMKEK